MLNLNSVSEDQEENIYDKHYFATSQVYIESMNYKPILRPYTKEQIEDALRNPFKNYLTLQRMSNYLYSISSAYQNALDYFSTIMSFDYILSPIDFASNKKTMLKRLTNAAKKAKQNQVKTIFPEILKRTLTQGESYWYVLSDSENTIYLEIPSRFCEVCEIDSNNLFRYKIRLDYLNDDIVKSLPNEIKNAYHNFQENKKSRKQKIDRNDAMDSLKYKVSNNGFALLAHGMLNNHDYPYFANSFIDVLQLEQDKEYFNSNVRDDTTKLVHNKIPTDTDGKPLIPEPIIRQYHESDKKHVPKNVSVSTTPFEKEAISFDSSNRSHFNLVEQSKKNVQDDSGISSLVFNNEKSSSNALKDSIKADANRMFGYLKFFNAILSHQLKPYKFSATFLETDKFNKKDDHEQTRTDLQSGGSRMLFLATSKLEIYDYLQLSQLEKLVEIDDYLPIMIPGSQQSGIDGEKKNGRPVGEKDNISDNGETSQEYR